MKLPLIVFLVFGLTSAAVAAQESSYSGQEKRSIKSLSKGEVEGYLTGKGMGLAKSAELNSYPGPKHVMELSQELSLSKSQLEETKIIYEEMKGKAIER